MFISLVIAYQNYLLLLLISIQQIIIQIRRNICTNFNNVNNVGSKRSLASLNCKQHVGLKGILKQIYIYMS